MKSIYLVLVLALTLTGPAKADTEAPSHYGFEDDREAMQAIGGCYQVCADQQRDNRFTRSTKLDQTLANVLGMLDAGWPNDTAWGYLSEQSCIMATANIVALESCYSHCRDLERYYPRVSSTAKTRFVNWFNREKELVMDAGLVSRTFVPVWPTDDKFEEACEKYHDNR